MKIENSKKNYDRVFANICKGMYEYIKKYQIKSLVLGLSGGLDSTVCAALCDFVVRDFNVTNNGYKIKLIGIGLPCNTNTKEETDNEQLASSFCDNYYHYNLQSLYENALKSCESTMPSSTNISKGNIKARLRMLYLYNAASVNNGIVIDTDNLTEHYLGFWTIHGDEGDFNPIGALWKTEVYELAKYIVELYEKELESLHSDKYDETLKKIQALKNAISITPTDGNGVKEGGDLAQIAPGYTYNDVDKVLKRYVYWDLIDDFDIDSEDDIIDEIYNDTGIDIDTIQGIIKRYHSSGFKRKHRPFIIDTMKGNVCEKHITNDIIF